MEDLTNCYITHRGARRILEFLKENSGQIWDVKSISEACKIKKDYCYIYLARLKNEGFIERLSAGLYRYQGIGDLKTVEEKELKFHNLHLIQELGKGETPPHPHNKSNCQSNLIELDGRKVELRRNKDSVELLISASDNPLTFRELDFGLDLLDKIFNLGEKEAWRLVSFDVNVDLEGLRLDGMSALTYRDCKNLLYKAYNKEGKGLRLEIAANKVVPFSELANFFKGKGIAGVYELVHTVKDLQSGIRSLSYQYKRLNKFLDYKGVVV